MLEILLRFLTLDTLGTLAHFRHFWLRFYRTMFFFIADYERSGKWVKEK